VPIPMPVNNVPPPLCLCQYNAPAPPRTTNARTHVRMSPEHECNTCKDTSAIPHAQNAAITRGSRSWKDKEDDEGMSVGLLQGRPQDRIAAYYAAAPPHTAPPLYSPHRLLLLFMRTTARTPMLTAATSALNTIDVIRTHRVLLCVSSIARKKRKPFTWHTNVSS
jgi:hypothetical protein